MFKKKTWKKRKGCIFYVFFLPWTKASAFCNQHSQNFHDLLFCRSGKEICNPQEINSKRPLPNHSCKCSNFHKCQSLLASSTLKLTASSYLIYFHRARPTILAMVWFFPSFSNCPTPWGFQRRRLGERVKLTFIHQEFPLKVQSLFFERFFWKDYCFRKGLFINNCRDHSFNSLWLPGFQVPKMEGFQITLFSAILGVGKLPYISRIHTAYIQVRIPPWNCAVST